VLGIELELAPADKEALGVAPHFHLLDASEDGVPGGLMATAAPTACGLLGCGATDCQDEQAA
jgi:hypothetical protein